MDIHCLCQSTLFMSSWPMRPVRIAKFSAIYSFFLLCCFSSLQLSGLRPQLILVTVSFPFTGYKTAQTRKLLGGSCQAYFSRPPKSPVLKGSASSSEGLFQWCSSEDHSRLQGRCQLELYSIMCCDFHGKRKMLLFPKEASLGVTFSRWLPALAPCLDTEKCPTPLRHQHIGSPSSACFSSLVYFRTLSLPFLLC